MNHRQYRYSSHLIALTTLTLVALCSGRLASAAVMVIDGSNGAVYDSIIDGFPGVFTFDGTPDAGGNALAVALKAGVSEERAIAEFPLESLAGLTSADIVSATLTFNIDDVVGISFGPGANFDATAAEDIFLWAWNGNGTIAVTDFNKVTGAPAGSVHTGAQGAITDTTLTTTGPVDLAIDLTAALKARLDAAATHLGLTLATVDDNTATSIDNLGAAGAGPPSIKGAHMPVLSVVTVESAPPTLGKAERACQTGLAQQARSYANALTGHLATCMNRVLSDVASGKGANNAATFCAGKLDPANAKPAAAVTARTKASAAILKACKAPLTPSGIGSPCDAGATTFTDVATCVLNQASAESQALTRASYANACAILAAVALDAKYPSICGAP